MEDSKQASDTPSVAHSGGKSAVAGLFWFGLHLAAIYFFIEFCATWLAGRYHDWILPIVDPGNHTSFFQFEFSHLFGFTFIPPFVAGLINSRRGRYPALFVWIIPTVVLAYKLIAFHTTLFQDHYTAAFHYYFAGGFLIGEFHNYQDLFTVVVANPGAIRGLEQLRFTGPFYAGVGYSLAALVAPRVQLSALVQAFSRRDSKRPDFEEVEGANSENTAGTTYPAAPDGIRHRE